MTKNPFASSAWWKSSEGWRSVLTGSTFNYCAVICADCSAIVAWERPADLAAQLEKYERHAEAKRLIAEAQRTPAEPGSHFRIHPAAAQAWRDVLAKRIEPGKSYLGADGNYEEGVIDAIDWLLGNGDRPANWEQK